MKKSENSSWMNSSLLLPGCMFVGMVAGFMSIGNIKLLFDKKSNQNKQTN
ncbi:MAG: hypothetical protein R2764_17335 [Bacteroidales bacterium]